MFSVSHCIFSFSLCFKFLTVFSVSHCVFSFSLCFKFLTVFSVAHCVTNQDGSWNRDNGTMWTEEDMMEMFLNEGEGQGERKWEEEWNLVIL